LAIEEAVFPAVEERRHQRGLRDEPHPAVDEMVEQVAERPREPGRHARLVEGEVMLELCEGRIGEDEGGGSDA